MGVAVVRRLLTATLLAGVALATTGAAPAEERAMLEAFDAVLTAMAYAAAGLCVFAIVWAGFVLMAEGAEERGGGRARTAVVMAVVGLVLVLLAKAVAALLRSGIVPFPSPSTKETELKKLIERITRRKAEGLPNDAAAPQIIAEADPALVSESTDSRSLRRSLHWSYRSSSWCRTWRRTVPSGWTG